MKGLVKYVKESVFDTVKLYSDILTPEELDYEFKLIVQSARTVKDVITHDVKFYQKDPEENAKVLKKDITIDKLLVDNGFNNRDKSKLSVKGIDYGDLYFIKTKVNPKGYCVVFDPYDAGFHNWCFLVTAAASRVGKTLRPLEWVEPRDIEEKNHRYDEFDGIPRTFYDDPVEAWKYIEKKYGKF